MMTPLHYSFAQTKLAEDQRAGSAHPALRAELGYIPETA